MKYAYLQDNSTPEKVVRKVRLDTKLGELKLKKFKRARIIEKDPQEGYIETGLKFTEVNKDDFIKSAIKGLIYARDRYEEIALDFDLNAQIKKLAKKLDITQKEVKELLAKYESLEAEFEEK